MILTFDNTNFFNTNYRQHEKLPKSDWVRGVQYWPYLHFVFNICTFLLNNNKKNQHSISVAQKKKFIH